MLGSLRLTFVLLAILVLTVISSTSARHNQDQRQSHNVPDQRLIEEQKKQDKLRGQFPIVEYDAPENTDPKERAKRKEKNKHFDKRNFVSDDPTPRVTSMARIIEGYDVPALPVTQSGLIITGEVLTSQAHLSDDKSGVYTELTVRVQEILKNNLPSQINKGDVITADREGGIVLYSNGHRRLYQLAGEGMPVVSKQYVLFLRAIEQGEDFYVLTGYELSPGGVVPVDEHQHFKAYEGYDAQAFLNVLRSSIEHSQQAPVQ